MIKYEEGKTVFERCPTCNKITQAMVQGAMFTQKQGDIDVEIPVLVPVCLGCNQPTGTLQRKPNSDEDR